MAKKYITQLTGTTSPSLTGYTVYDNGSTTNKVTLGTLRQTLVNSGSHYFTGSQFISGDVLVGGASRYYSGQPEVIGAYNSGSFNSMVLQGNSNTYLQTYFRNLNSGSSASTDLVVGADNGSEEAHYINLGINSSGNSDEYLGRANDTYLMSVAHDFYIGTFAVSGHTSDIHIFTNGAWEDPRLFLSGSGQIGYGKHFISGLYNHEFSGSVYVDNQISASYFKGDGSRLTNLPSQTVNTGSLATTGSNTFNGNQTINGSVTASYFVGDGGQLTNIPIGVDASYLRAHKSGSQTGSNNNPIIFDTIDNTFGSDISLNTTTGIVTLQSNKTYRLRGALGYVGFSGSGGGYTRFQWYNQTTSTYVGNIVLYQVFGSNTEYAVGDYGTAETIITTTGTTQFKLNTLNRDGGGATMTIGDPADGLPWFDIEVIGGNTNVTNSTANQLITNLSHPTGISAGYVYFNTTDTHFYGYNGTTWKQLDN